VPRFKLDLTDIAEAQLEKLRTSPSLAKRYKSVRKALGYLEKNPRYPGLNAHKYRDLKGPNGEEVFEVCGKSNARGLSHLLVLRT
jgi:hypothetical protein